MTVTRALMIAFYSVAYALAVYAGVAALNSGDSLYSCGLFGTSMGLLLGIHREFRHAARLVRVAVAYRHAVQFSGPAGELAAIERATALPPGCRCEKWWTSLGAQHDPCCPARIRKDA